MSTNKIDLVRAEIERLKKDWQCYLRYSVESKYRTEAYTELLEFINSLPEEPVSEELEEAAVDYGSSHPNIHYDADGNSYDDIDKPAIDFEAGAEWQKQQMMKEAFDAEVINWASMFTSVKVLEPERAEAMIKEKFDIGDKVKVIIIKPE